MNYANIFFFFILLLWVNIFIILYTHILPTITITNTKGLKNYLDDERFHIYNPHDFENLTNIASGGSSLVHVAYWKNTTKVAIKKFNEISEEEGITNEIKIIRMVSHHPYIIQFYGITKFKGESHYSLVLEYADGGTLKDYLRNNAIIKWESQLKFAKEIAAAILWLHYKKIIHGDLHPNNILIHQNMVKLADFGCSRLQGTECHTKPRGIIPYMDPKILDNPEGFDLTEKSDIYSLGVILWELTTCSSPFDGLEKDQIKLMVLKRIRKRPYPGTDRKFVTLYEACWKHEPDERPDIYRVVSELNSIDHYINPENTTDVSNHSNSQESKAGNEDLYLSSCEVIT